MRSSLLATLGATAVAGPLGVLVQRQLTFDILSLGERGTWEAVLGYVLAVAVLGLLTALVAGAPVEWTVRRMRLPGAPWTSVPLSAALAVGLFALLVPWGLKPWETALLLALTAVFFAVRVALLARGARPPLVDLP